MFKPTPTIHLIRTILLLGDSYLRYSYRTFLSHVPKKMNEIRLLTYLNSLPYLSQKVGTEHIFPLK